MIDNISNLESRAQSSPHPIEHPMTDKHIKQENMFDFDKTYVDFYYLAYDYNFPIEFVLTDSEDHSAPGASPSLPPSKKEEDSLQETSSKGGKCDIKSVCHINKKKSYTAIRRHTKEALASKKVLLVKLLAQQRKREEVRRPYQDKDPHSITYHSKTTALLVGLFLQSFHGIKDFVGDLSVIRVIPLSSIWKGKEPTLLGYDKFVEAAGHIGIELDSVWPHRKDGPVSVTLIDCHEYDSSVCAKFIYKIGGMGIPVVEVHGQIRCSFTCGNVHTASISFDANALKRQLSVW